MTTKQILTVPVLGLMLALLFAAPSSASILQLNFTLANPAQSFVPGGPIVAFIGTITAPSTNSANVFLNGDSNNVDYPLLLDDSPFFNNAPLFLTPGQSYTGELFAVTVPNTAVSGVTYNGYFEIDGGADGNAGDALASATFTLTATPEPGTLILLFSGLAALAVAFRRKHRHSAV